METENQKETSAPRGDGSDSSAFVMPDIEFITCNRCYGYGVRDNGKNCTTCGGKGRGGLLGNGTIGSGELMYDKGTGRQITHKELSDLLKRRKA